MKKLVVSAMAVATLSSLACTRFEAAKGQMLTPPVPTTDTNLAGKSVAEVISLKYEKALLVCSVVVSNASLDISPVRSSTLVVDLKTENLEGQEFTLEVKAPAVQSTTKFSISSVGIEDSNIVLLSKNERYIMVNSPFIKIEVQNQLQVTEHLVSLSGRVEDKIIENVPSTIRTPHASGWAKKVFNDLECIIETAAKPAFKDQFKTKNLSQTND